MSNSITINDSSNNFPTVGQKMSFSQTCNLLSQYVKEKRALGGLTAEGFNRSTMNLFPVKQVDDSNTNVSVGRTIDLFPQISGFNSSANKRESPEPPAAQMTIFYGGQVVVFNDLPADKASEVMNLANRFQSSLKKKKVETPASSIVPISALAPTANTKSAINQNPTPTPNPTVSQPRAQKVTLGVPQLLNNVIPSAAAALPRADLPIARKASLHRFLEKRKDRLVGKAPPSANSANDGSAPNPVEAKAWLGLNSVPAFQKQQQ